jgi:hypothetical protein
MVIVYCGTALPGTADRTCEAPKRKVVQLKAAHVNDVALLSSTLDEPIEEGSFQGS